MYLMDVPGLLTEKYKPVKVMHIFLAEMSKAFDEISSGLSEQNKKWEKVFIVNDMETLMYVPMVPIAKNKEIIVSNIDEETIRLIRNGGPIPYEGIDILNEHYNTNLFNFITHSGLERDGAEASIINFDKEYRTMILEMLYKSIMRLQDNLNNHFVGKYEIIKPNAPFDYSIN